MQQKYHTIQLNTTLFRTISLGEKVRLLKSYCCGCLYYIKSMELSTRINMWIKYYKGQASDFTIKYNKIINVVCEV